jgi:hypothetical protein
MPKMGNKFFGSIVILVVLGWALAQPAFAQLRSEPPLRDEAGGLLLAAQGVEVWLPAPSWIDPALQQSGNIRPEVEAVFRNSGSGALLEIYPKGESEALWSTVYGVRISTGSRFTLKEYRAAVMSGFARNCSPALTGFFQLGTDEDDVLAPLGHVCGAYDPRLRLYSGLGEVMVMSFRQEGDTVALIFQQWRGKSFNPSDPASWPVDTGIVEAQARQLQAEPRLTRAD